MKSILIIVDSIPKLNLEITENNTIHAIKQILLSQGFLNSMNPEKTKQIKETEIRFYINENTKMNDVFYKTDWDKLTLKTIWDKLNNARIVFKTKETKEISSIRTRAAKFYDDNMKMLYLDYMEKVSNNISENISKEKEHFIDVYTQAATKIDPSMIHDNQEYLDKITDSVYTAFQIDGKHIREDYKSYIFSNLKVSLFFGI